MVQTKKLKLFNDPIYGFIGTPNELIFRLIGHPYFQRLRRISQMGMSYLVYPGAHHTRFHHALGSMHLMTKAIQVLRLKDIEISEEEEKGLLGAILLHDIGHGPFSHALEGFIIDGVGHETLSLEYMKALNEEFDSALDLAIEIFNGKYPKPFLNQLVSSQLDMDRLDYLKRDSFYTGVTEGNINSERLISMLNVVDGNLVVEEKGIYAIEKFLMARRFMYWQVYLHKTSLVAEQLLIRIMQRAKELMPNQSILGEDSTLYRFLFEEKEVGVNRDRLSQFALLDDIDILAAIKKWRFHEDFVLSKMCQMLLDRNLLTIKLKKSPVQPEKVEAKLNSTSGQFGISKQEASYFVFTGEISNNTYNQQEQEINILKKNGKVVHLLKESDALGTDFISRKVTKYYLCYPK
ncbi:HD domain-containing protein [Flagellimonas allohymeniacidonis]|uniref:HD domain-containing protein n=1 Tax=Flagellimonas allohymeniacidonis TaxID=2517819 RepID=A0A4Q8QE79_9FLAO|nr:HD domain-containing protein [Allomuricauda hymeniacidonis]TAI48731.1 HD domain-containing protein [Allomuricauda hymeniacidonis]